jgi:hypothetical protein
MENNKALKTGTIQFDILENRTLQIKISCSEFYYLELLGFLEEAKFTLMNDNKTTKYE